MDRSRAKAVSIEMLLFYTSTSLKLSSANF
nr:MAG TPA: hypothetical protein [Caudoviricetes sp.]